MRHILVLEVGEALVEVVLGMPRLSVLFALGLRGCADEGLHADFALDVHGLLVGLELAALGCLVLLGVPLAGHLGLLAVAAAHGWWWFLRFGCSCEKDSLLLPQKCLQAHPTQLIALEPMMSMIHLNHVLGDQSTRLAEEVLQ